MATTGFVSKACFVFKPKTKKAKVPKAENYFDQENLERLETFQQLWLDISADIQSLGSELNSKIFNDLLTFTQNAYTNSEADSSAGRPARYLEIPTAALITGVNTPDHNVMFANLTDLLREKVSPYVAMLRSKDCANMKQIMAKTLTQIMTTQQMGLDDSDSMEGKEPTIKVRNYTMDVLSAWYSSRQQNQKSSSPKKKSKSNPEKVKAKSPIVILFEDLEAFPAHVLQDFILICSNHLKELPIVLIFGIATTVTAVHRVLPHAVSSLLCMEKFQAPPSTEYMSQVMNKVVMTAKYPFKVGGRVFRLLLDMFLYHDFSVVNFVRGYQFSMMQHYYNNPLSIVCCPHAEVKDRVNGLNNDQLEQLRRAVSFRSYVESRPSKEQILLLTDDSYFKGVLCNLVKGLHSYHENFFPILVNLNILTRGLPKHPLGKQLRETYSMCLESNIFEMECYKEAMDLLSTLSRDDMTSLMKQCIDKMSASLCSKELEDVVARLKEFVHKFENIEDLSQMLEPENTEENGDLLLPKKTDMHTLRKTLLEKKKKKLTVYEVLRNEACSYFDQLFRKYLKCPQMLPMYETLYYDVASEVRQHTNAAPRAAIQTALTNPYVYLQNQSLIVDTEGISNCLPDISIVYKLHLECGRMINLYDWLQAFITVVTSGQPNDVIEREQKQPSQTLQARFIRAVSELQFLGFIKPTKRKTDHVARLTWGGC